MTVDRKVTVFGGTGFLGQRIVRHLLARGFSARIATRRPDRSRSIFGAENPAIESVRGDVNDDASVAAALAGAAAVVNAVSLYVERGPQTFHAVHVEAAARLAKHSHAAGIERLAHVSGLGADAASRSPYIRSRGLGEQAVLAAFSNATIVRPAVMFGPNDAFLVPLMKLLRRAPVFPMFGGGQTRLQPSYVEDVAEAIVRMLQASELRAPYELGGPREYTYERILRMLAGHVGTNVTLIPVPFAVWHPLAFAAELLPKPPITRNQIELMQTDNVADPQASGFGTLGIEPQSIEQMLPAIFPKD